MQKEFNWSIVSSILIGIMLLSSFFGWFTPEVVTPNFPTAAEIASLIVIPIANSTSVLDNDKLDDVYDKVYEDDVWEDEAEKLATEEWSEKDNKDLYRFIRDSNHYGDIDDESDIIYVREDESTDFSSMDADDKDGVVTQYLKVKYEDENGKDRKVYITVETKFDDGDLEYQDFSKS